MAWGIQDIPDLTGKTAVVTGANGGLGLETARALAGAGAHVFMAARDQDKARAAAAGILHEIPTASTELVPLDLASLASVSEAAAAISAATDTVDILINNAGLMAMPERRTVDGFEMQLGVNHLGHWALNAHLMPALLVAGSGRVVTVTSFARLMGTPVSSSNPHMDHEYDPWKAYGRSKLANLLFAMGLHMEFRRRALEASSIAAHPGLAHTGLQVRTVDEGGTGMAGNFWKGAARTVGMSQKTACLPQLRAATDLAARSGELYGPRYMLSGPAVRRTVLRRGLARDVSLLWEMSEAETGLSLFQFVD
jgi:NAD(P)-dependent dehydrogenase (short-subunit alcohol dehydrogenase family)